MKEKCVCVCVCVCASESVCTCCTYSDSFLFDSSNWQYFAGQGQLPSHGHVLTHWLLGCKGQQCCDNGAAGTWSVLWSRPLDTRTHKL